MNVETMIYAYLVICVSMILFNCACIFVFRGRDTRLNRNSARLEKEISRQFRQIEGGVGVDANHLLRLRKKLVYTRNLIVFDHAMEHLQLAEPQMTARYLDEIYYPVILHLAVRNRYNAPVKMAYFAHVLAQYQLLAHRPKDLLFEMLLDLVRNQNLYCRENALRALYSAGDCGSVLKAMLIVDESPGFHHAKLLTDGLLSFKGDKALLADTLWKKLDAFSVPMQVVVLDFIRFSGQRRDEEMLRILADIHRDDEIRFSCLRYFGRNSCESAYPLLLHYVQEPWRQRWEYAAIAATSLASYPGERTVEVLKTSLSNSNWYIRFNAAKSLEGLGLSYLDLNDIFEGNDRYAREILLYQRDMNQVKAKRQEEKTV